MRRMSDDEGRAATLSVADIDALILEGRFGKTDLSLRRLDALVPSLEQGSDVEAFLLALYGRALLLRRLGDRTDDVIEACDVLERTAQSQQDSTWAAVACATRAEVRIDLGELGTAMSDVARADRELDRVDLGTSAGFRLFGVLATVYARLRLPDQMDDARERMDAELDAQHPAHRAMHWSAWSTELVVRAMEPVAAGSTEPDPRRSAGPSSWPAGWPPCRRPRCRRSCGGSPPPSGPWPPPWPGAAPSRCGCSGRTPSPAPSTCPRSNARSSRWPRCGRTPWSARWRSPGSLDEAARSSQQLENQLMLELCRARERLYLETHAGGDLVPILNRLSELLVRLGWRGMQLVSDAARQTLQHHTLHAESRTDPLTGVGNRRALDEELRQLLRFSPLPMSLVLVDIDDFKDVNDKFTHVVGDEVLRRVAATLTQQLRTGDRLLRFGGDEFVVLLPRIGDQEANHVAARMAAAVADRSWGELADGLQVTVTTGCAALWSLTGRRPDGDAERLFRRADEALLESKRRRKRDTGSLSAFGAALATGPIPLPPASGSIPQPVPQSVPQSVPQPSAVGPAAGRRAARAVAAAGDRHRRRGPAAARDRRDLAERTRAAGPVPRTRSRPGAPRPRPAARPAAGVGLADRDRPGAELGRAAAGAVPAAPAGRPAGAAPVPGAAGAARAGAAHDRRLHQPQRRPPGPVRHPATGRHRDPGHRLDPDPARPLRADRPAAGHHGRPGDAVGSASPARPGHLPGAEPRRPPGLPGRGRRLLAPAVPPGRDRPQPPQRPAAPAHLGVIGKVIHRGLRTSARFVRRLGEPTGMESRPRCTSCAETSTHSGAGSPTWTVTWPTTGPNGSPRPTC